MKKQLIQALWAVANGQPQQQGEKTKKIQAELFKMTKSKKCITCLFCIGDYISCIICETRSYFFIIFAQKSKL